MLWVRSYFASDTCTRLTRFEDTSGVTLVRDFASWGRGQFAVARLRYEYGNGQWSPNWGTPESTWTAFQRIRGWDSAEPRLPLIVRAYNLRGPSLLSPHYHN